MSRVAMLAELRHLSLGMFVAELRHLVLRRATVTVGAIWLVTVGAFAYAVPYLVYRASRTELAEEGADPEQLLAPLLPSGLAGYSVSLYALFGAAYVLILGALAIGNEYRWRTLGILFVQGPGRTAVMLTKSAALAAVLLGLAVAALVASAGYSLVIAAVEGRPVTWPSPGLLLAAIGATWLATLAFAGVGFALAVVFRSTATALAVGLVWALGLENAVNGLATVLPWLAGIQTVLIGPSVGSLAVAMGESTMAEGGTPGVVDTASPPVAVVVLAGYALVAAAVSVVVQRRRDVA